MNVYRSLAVAAALVLACNAALAQEYPVKPVRLIVPFPPGGSTDVLGRIVATKLSETLGQQVIVDNRSGAGGIIGTALGARAQADGYTINFGSTAVLAINPAARRAFEKAGFAVEGTLRADRWTGAGFVDTHVLGRLRG